ncbi:unnamed protein product [Discosporangium mesarthrocarpum]
MEEKPAGKHTGMVHFSKSQPVSLSLSRPQPQRPVHEGMHSYLPKNGSFNPFLFILSLPKYHEVFRARKSPLLPPRGSPSRPRHSRSRSMPSSLHPTCSRAPPFGEALKENDNVGCLDSTGEEDAENGDTSHSVQGREKDGHWRRKSEGGGSSGGNGKITLLLDLDETLVHCTTVAVEGADMEIPIQFKGASFSVHVRKRPHLDEFLRAVSSMSFEVVVFTASEAECADRVLDALDPDRSLIQHRLFRGACLRVRNNFVKDLNVLGRDLSRVALVDNSPHAYGYQLDNGVPIPSWFGEDKEDDELLKLLPFLESLRWCVDVRAMIRDKFKTRAMVEAAGVVVEAAAVAAPRGVRPR